MRLLRKMAAIAVSAMALWTASEVLASKPQRVEASPEQQRWSQGKIDFSQSLGVGSASLRSLGTRLEEARSSLDPISLAAAACELAAAETASGKAVALTSKEVIDEAVELARLRGRSMELKAVAALAGPAGRLLEEDIRKAQEREADRARAAASGEISKGVAVSLRVLNLSSVAADVTCCGRSVGTVASHSSADYTLPDLGRPFYLLSARGDDGRQWTLRLTGQYGSVEWVLNDN